MKVKVRFFAHLRELTGKKVIDEVDCEEGTTISMLLDWLSSDSRIKDILFDQNLIIKPDISILKNGREIRLLEGMQTRLHSGDEIAIFPRVVGGQWMQHYPR